MKLQDKMILILKIYIKNEIARQREDIDTKLRDLLVEKMPY